MGYYTIINLQTVTKIQHTNIHPSHPVPVALSISTHHLQISQDFVTKVANTEHCTKMQKKLFLKVPNLSYLTAIAKVDQQLLVIYNA